MRVPKCSCHLPRIVIIIAHVSKKPKIMKLHSVSCRQGGFTLVEIAIVLMIVGLLIGGILRGQELIQSARVRNLADQKSAVQTAYIGFLDRYRMLPGDLTAAQAAEVGNGVLAAPGPTDGDGNIAWATDSTVFFQNLTAAGFIACGACMTVTAVVSAPTVSNTLINVYGDYLAVGHANSNNLGTSWFDAAAAPGIRRLIVPTGGSVPSQVLAELDRKADDGLPGGGMLRYHRMATSGLAAVCAPGLSQAAPASAWANPNQANCAGTWLF
jgi:prepilin-type N-terminal cleavage/methylation domain-containing protein